MSGSGSGSSGPEGISNGCRIGNVTRAAESLHTVQSNVTSGIRQPEGTTFFVRRNRGVRLTRAGELLLTYAQSIERLVDEAAKAVSEFSGGGDLHIGAVETVIAVRLATPIAEFGGNTQR
jgi:LysR family transcriptional regulator, cell division regulator